MKNTTSLLAVVTGLSAILVALVMFWLAFLPDRLSTAVMRELEQRAGLRVAVASSSLSFRDGFSLQLQNVSLAESDGQSVPTASMERLSVPLSLTTLLGAKPALTIIDINKPMINIKTGGAVAFAQVQTGDVAVKENKKPRALTINIHDATVKWSDARRASVVAMSSINGSFKTDVDGTLAAELTGVLNGKLTRISGSVDDIGRARGDGSPSDMTIASEKNLLSFSGRAQLGHGVTLDGRATASAENLRDILDWLGLPVSGFAATGTVTADAGISWDGTRLAMRDMAATLGPSHISGNLSVDVSSAQPALEADLKADVINLGSYTRLTDAIHKGDMSPLSKPWAEQVFDIRDLATMTAKIDASADKLMIGDLETGQASLALRLSDSNLALTLNSANVAGGSAHAEWRVSDNKGALQHSLKLDAKNASAKKFLQPLAGFSALDGPLRLEANLTTTGDSPSRLISSLAGEASISMQNGNLNGISLASFVTGKGKGWQNKIGAFTALTKLDANFDLQDGVARISTLQLSAAGASLEASGEIDLLRQHLDVTCKPRLDGVSRSPMQLNIAGPWNEPDVVADFDALKLKPKALLQTGKKAIKKLFGN